MMPSNHLIVCHPLLLLSSIFPSIRIFSNESVLCIRWPKYWSFSCRISPFNEYSGLIAFRIDWSALLAVQGTVKSLLFSVQDVYSGGVLILCGRNWGWWGAELENPVLWSSFWQHVYLLATVTWEIRIFLQLRVCARVKMSQSGWKNHLRLGNMITYAF